MLHALRSTLLMKRPRERDDPVRVAVTLKVVREPVVVAEPAAAAGPRLFFLP